MMFTDEATGSHDRVGTIGLAAAPLLGTAALACSGVRRSKYDQVTNLVQSGADRLDGSTRGSWSHFVPTGYEI